MYSMTISSSSFVLHLGSSSRGDSFEYSFLELTNIAVHSFR